jgi:ankyrin repeat protein
MWVVLVVDILNREDDHGGKHNLLKTGRTPLSWAAEKSGNETIVQMLLEQGALTEAADINGPTPLSWAAGRPGSESVVQVLLQHGACMNAHDNGGRGPLSYAP